MSLSHSLKILFVSRSTLYKQPGGDTVQVEQTAHYLRELGCQVDIYTSGDKPDVMTYDAIHFFNLIRPFDLLPFLAKGHPPLFISSIYIDYSRSIRYVGKQQRLLQALLGKHLLELIKAKARWVKGKDRFPGLSYLFKGQKGSIRLILKKCKAVIAATKSEIDLIEEDFNVTFRGERIRLGTEHIGHFKTIEKKEKKILCAARIEAIKNQLNLIRAVSQSELELTLAGKAATHQASYFEKCKAEADSRTSFKGQLTSDELKKEYAQAKIHALPSFFETTGLSSLEALLAGCQIVVSDTPIQREIFGDKAHYCDPHEPENILKAIEKASAQNSDHSDWVKENFNWQKSAKKILNLYQEYLTNNQI